MKTSKGNRKDNRDPLATLKAWVHWATVNPVSEDQAEMAKDINDLISQLGTWKAKYEQATSKARNVEHTIPHGEYGTCSACESTQDAHKRGDE